MNNLERGYCIFVQKHSDVDYLKQAYALGISIKTHMPDSKIFLMTNLKIPSYMQGIFDIVGDIPGSDLSAGSDWKVENRYKLYDCTPFEESIILDADMLVCGDISHWWKFLRNFNFFFTSAVHDYRGDTITSNYYRATFIENTLPNLYCGVHYYKRSPANRTFVKLIKDVVCNYKEYSEVFCPNKKQRWVSMDVSVSIAAKILGLHPQITSTVPYITFTHMKPHLQGWDNVPAHWMEKINVCCDDKANIKLGNFAQKGILHYVEPEFLTPDLLLKLESRYHASK